MIPYPYNLAVLLAALVAAFAAGWQTQGWRRDSQEIERVETAIESERLAGRARLGAETRVVNAQNAAAARARDALADAADARSELDRVRALSDAALGAANVSHAACLDRAAALNDVFKSCTAEVGGVAEKADRHVSDIKTLIESWPR